MRRVVLGLTAVLITGCASIPRDAGLADVRERTGAAIEWRRDGTAPEDPRVRELLARELDAESAVAVAMANNPRLQVILAELGIAQAELIEATTISNPIFEYETRFPGAPYRPYEIILAQSLIELIQLPRRREIGQAGFEAAKLRVSAEVLRFAATVRDSYYAAVAASASAEMSRTATAAARTSAELAVRQHAAGNITDLDLENEQAVYEQARIALARAEEHLVVAREALIRDLGLRDGNPALTIRNDFPPLPERDATAEELSNLVQARRLDIAVAQREVEIAQRRVPLARLAALGEVVVDVHREREPEGTKTTGPGIAFPIPIFNTGRAARTRAEAEFLRARYRLAELTARAGSEARTARERLEAARARVEYYRDVVLPRRARIVELTKLEQNVMLVGVYQLLQARQNEANARREYIEAQRDYWSARVNLDRVINGTGPIDFETAAGNDVRRSGERDRRGDH
jgi:cobalt-zinc-cadmium efflux system outer membrane protein